MTALSFEQGATIFGIVMTILGVIVQAIYLVRRFTQQEERAVQRITAVQASVASVQATVAAAAVQSTSDMKDLADTQAAAMKGLEERATGQIAQQNRITEMRFDELGRRVGRVESTLGSITKVVVFSDGK